jgi:homoserine O-acetyltransferase/O-succinyltransferase
MQDVPTVTTTATKPARKGQDDPPDSPTSVGWTEAQLVRLVGEQSSFQLQSGESLAPVDVEFETYGTLNAARDNVILIAHALSGDAHVAGWDRHATTINGRRYRARHPGWWDTVIGPTKAIDTRRYFVICANVLGSCYGTTGPGSINPATGRPYGMKFPPVTVADWVRLQALLLDHLGVERLHAVVGGSLGGQQALEWALAFPDRVQRSIVLAASPRLSAQGLAFNAVGRQAIITDPNFNGGDYYGRPLPAHGLAIARMMAHITYLSEEGMGEKFGRKRRQLAPLANSDAEFEVESYLKYQGQAFTERFDANSYLYITRAMDYYDAADRWADGDLVAACGRIRSKVMVVSFSSDWLYTPQQCREFALAMCRAGKTITYVNVPSKYGHDAFLVETAPVSHLLRSFRQ